MDPRLKTSTQWSPFPEELCEQMVATLRERFEEEYGLEDMEFIVEGRIFPGEILTRVGLAVDGQLKQHNFEFSFEYDNEKEQTLECIQNSMDVIEHVWTEFLEEDMEDSEMPREWQSMPLNKIMYFFKYTTLNSRLEAEADKLLQEYDNNLLNEQKELPSFKIQEGEDVTLH
jgi:hypothetical protein